MKIMKPINSSNHKLRPELITAVIYLFSTGLPTRK